MTTFRDNVTGKRCPGSLGVLRNSGYLRPEFVEILHNIFTYYHSKEMDLGLTNE